MSQAVVDLDASSGYLLKQASSALRTRMDAALAPLGLNVTQYSCLELLAHRPRTSGAELARGAFVTRQSMHTVLQGLRAEGLVRLPEAAAVGRVLPAELTEAGRERLAAASAAVRAVEQAAESGLSEAETALLRDLLTRYAVGLAG